MLTSICLAHVPRVGPPSHVRHLCSSSPLPRVTFRYHLSWEVYRIRGEPGSPLEMWEPKRALMNTQALLDWDERLSREA